MMDWPTVDEISGTGGEEAARAYYEWFISTAERRAEAVRVRLQLPPDFSFEQLDESLPAALRSSAPYHTELPFLIDVGTLAGQRFIAGHNQLKWAFLGTDERLDVDRFRPVIIGFRTGTHLNPVTASLNVASAVREGRTRPTWRSVTMIYEGAL